MTRGTGEGRQVRRRRECLKCAERFTTFESAQLVMPHLIKSDNRREPFDSRKLRSGMARALEKRPVASEDVEAAVARIVHRLQTQGEREIPARVLGEMVMDELKELDEVAFVRFASVYRQFQDVEAFAEEIERLQASARRLLAKKQMSRLPDDDN